MKGLIIDQPWISKILRGEKTWEMRRTACHYRGPVALIRKGSGAVVGIGRIVDSRPPLDTWAAYAEATPFHGIPTAEQEQAFARGWRIPWVLADVCPLPRPVRYRHPAGAVIWVTLDPGVITEIKVQTPVAAASVPSGVPPVANASTESGAIDRAACSASAAPRPSVSAPSEPARPVASVRVPLSGGSIRNRYISLASVLDFFPTDVIGGSNKDEAAPRMLEIRFSPGPTIVADIDGTKKVLRARGAVRDFFQRSGAVEGDALVIERIASYRFTVSLERAL